MCAPEHRQGPRARQRGLSIIELMVGIVVSMLVGLAAAGSAVMFTASQRQAMGTGGATINSSTVTNAIKADVSLAGLGFFNNSAQLCTNLNLSVAANVVSDGAAFSPLKATRGADSDQLDLLYASTIEAGASVLLDSPSDGTSAALRSLLPVSVGQAVLMSPANAAGLCTVRTVSTVAAATPTDPQKLTFAAAGKHNAAAFAGAGVYDTSARVTLLGNLRWNRYRVDADGRLLLERPLEADSAVLLRDVIAFRVQYGVAVNDTTPALDSWVDATGTFATIDATNIERIRAVRVGVMVKSPQREKLDQAGNCVATTTAPSLFGTVPAAFDSGDWRCYRYRTSTVVVPLRNYVM